MAKKSFTQIVTDMINYIKYKDTTIDTEVGSITRDVVVEPVANSVQEIYVENEHVGLIHSLFNWASMSDDELDQLVYNYGITRNSAIEATGTVVFRRNVALTDDILIPQDTIVATKKTIDESAINFITTADEIMYLALSATYYNSLTGYYEISVAVQAEIAGIDGNVASSSILTIQSAIPGINSVINIIATTGGTDEESNEALANRALLALTGNNVGTESGYLSTVLSNAYILDALLIGPGDALMTRDSGLGGKVDIYVVASLTNANTYTSTTYEYTYTDLSGGSGATDAANDKILPLQPVKAITSIVGVLGAVTTTYTQGIDFELQYTSSSSVYKGSTQALDKMHWLLNSPQTGETITITYTYYSIMTILDNLIEANRTVTADILVKLAVEVPINVSLTVYADDTITASGEATFNAAIVSAIATYIETNTLGSVIQQSDIVKAVYAVSGVDRIVLPFTVLNAPSIPAYATGVHDEMVLTSNQYATDDVITVTVIKTT